MPADSDLVDLFEAEARDRLAECPWAWPRWDRSRRRPELELTVPRRQEGGFDVVVAVERWGLYPSAAGWHGGAWEPMPGYPAEEVVRECLALLRSLLSPDARLTRTLRRGKAVRTALELHGPAAWCTYGATRHWAWPFGSSTREVLQNEHLSSRWPYAGLTRLGGRDAPLYEWSRDGDAGGP